MSADGLPSGWIPYKDTFAARGSTLHDAITEGDMVKAKALYDDSNRRYEALVRPEFRMYNKKTLPGEFVK